MKLSEEIYWCIKHSEKRETTSDAMSLLKGAYVAAVAQEEKEEEERKQTKGEQ